MRSKVSSRISSESLPRRTAWASDELTRSRPASTARSSASRTTTSRPARAATSAMPEPIRPAPDDADLHEIGAGVHWLAHIRPRRKLTAGVAAGKVSVEPDGEVADVGDERDPADGGGRVAAQEHQRVGLLERASTPRRPTSPR